MRLGFTGTKNGMTLWQKETVKELLQELDPQHFSHGDCVGADEEAHILVREVTSAEINIYPPTKDDFRSFRDGDVMHPAAPYIERNHAIVDASEVLLATPNGFKELLRSGTWATVRYAEKQKVPIYIVWPDGSMLNR